MKRLCLALIYFVTTQLGATQTETVWRERANRDKAPITVLHIQDIHSNLEAQTQISATLSQLIQKGAVDLVGLEGTDQFIDLVPYHAYPQPDAVRKGAEAVLQTDEISGAVHAGVTQRKNAPHFFGLEEIASYKSHIKAYVQAAPLQTSQRKALEEKAKRVLEQKRKIFNTPLFHFDQAMEAFESGRSTLDEYLYEITSKRTLIPSTIAKVQDALEKKAPLLFDTELFFEETQQLEKEQRASRTKTLIEGKLFSFSRALTLSQKLVNFSLSSQEWNEYQQIPPSTLNDVCPPIVRIKFEAFYHWAEKRDEILAKNFLKHIHETKARNTVLVAGGFHSKGIRRILKKSGCTIISYVPRITNIDPAKTSDYLSYFLQENNYLPKDPTKGLPRILELANKQLGTKLPSLPIPKLSLSLSLWGNMKWFRNVAHTRWFVSLVVPLLETWMLPGFAVGLNHILPMWVTIPLASLISARLHGSLPEADVDDRTNEYDQTWGQFWVRALGAALINSLALGSMSISPPVVEKYLPARLMWEPLRALVTGVAAHGIWNFLNPEKFRLSLPYEHNQRFTIKDGLVHPKFKGTEVERKSKAIEIIEKLFQIADRRPKVTQPELAMDPMGHLLSSTLAGETLYLSQFASHFGKMRMMHGDADSQIALFYFDKSQTMVLIQDNDEEFYDLLKKLFRLLKGNEFEIDNTWIPATKIYFSAWDKWNKDNVDYQMYEKHIDPLIVKTVTDDILRKRKNKHTVLDVAGGDGRLLNSIAKALKQAAPEKNLDLHLLDQSAVTQRAGSEISINAIRTFVNSELDLEKIIGTKADIVIAEGFLTRQVTNNKQEAIFIARNIFKSLEEEGIFILTGITNSFLNSDDLKEIGFEVLNMSIPQNFPDRIPPYQFYISRKPKRVLTDFLPRRDQGILGTRPTDDDLFDLNKRSLENLGEVQGFSSRES